MFKKITLILSFLPFLLSAQSKSRYKYELIGGVGIANFLGDLGGADKVGTHLLNDFEFRATRPNIVAGVRYKVNNYFSFKGVFTSAIVAGKDSWTNETYRNNRNLSFRSPILELSAQAEYYFLREKMSGIYKISNFKKKRSRKTTAYLLAGAGVFFYSPSAESWNGKRYRLRKMHTEGQGLPGGPKQYSNFSICIPVGIGFKYLIDRRWSIGAEVALRKTFTDYIDDVSNKYVDPVILSAEKGATAATMSNRSENPETYLNNTGKLRGNPNTKDWYFFYGVTLSIKLKQKPKECRGR